MVKIILIYAAIIFTNVKDMYIFNNNKTCIKIFIILLSRKNVILEILS